MPTPRLLVFSLTCFAATAAAQDAAADPLAAAQARLDKALPQAAALGSATFAMTWDDSATNPLAAILAQRGGQEPPKSELSGAWHGDLLAVTYAQEQRLLQHGRRTAVAGDDGAWLPRRSQLANGNNLAFVPDVPQVLALLAHLRPKVVRREVGTLDDRPVETLTVTLTGEQALALAECGLLPGAGMSGGITIAMAANAARPPKPTLVDLACTLDPATGTLHRLHGRIYAESPLRIGGRVRIAAAGAGAAPVVLGDDAEEEGATPKQTVAEASKAPATEFRDALPVRSLKDAPGLLFDLRIRQHGEAPKVEVPAGARALLGLPQ